MFKNTTWALSNEFESSFVLQKNEFILLKVLSIKWSLRKEGKGLFTGILRHKQVIEQCRPATLGGMRAPDANPQSETLAWKELWDFPVIRSDQHTLGSWL